MTDFAAIDFETANARRSSVCSVGYARYLPCTTRLREKNMGSVLSMLKSDFF